MAPACRPSNISPAEVERITLMADWWGEPVRDFHRVRFASHLVAVGTLTVLLRWLSASERQQMRAYRGPE